jgi:hypothetical protein
MAKSKLADRPGLATSTVDWKSYSPTEVTPFYRKSDVPDAVDRFHYNDADGAESMMEMLGRSRHKSGSTSLAGGRLKGGLTFQNRRYYSHLEGSGKKVFLGKKGAEYQIRLENQTKERQEVIVSVDSLHVRNGQPASYKQRGYVLEPKGQITIDGFRDGENYVRGFRFSSVAGSKAASVGAERNVGVIGVAVFEEDTAKAKLKLRQEQFQREEAEAFTR